MVREYLDPALKRAGFIRKARTWNRQRADFTDVVDVQASRWDSQGAVTFTVNLGVFVPAIYGAAWQKTPPDFIREVDCNVRLRLGALLADSPGSKQRDRWWTVSKPSDLETVGQDVAASLVSRAIPFLGQLDSLSAIHDFLSNEPAVKTQDPLRRLYLAVVKAELGDVAASARMLGELYATAPAWRDRVLAAAGQLGIRLPVESTGSALT